MAFNPFQTFQKNQKFWMAAILLITMVTFVFCTGSGGDMQDRLIRMFSRGGPAVAEVGNRNLSNFELTRVRDDRNMVNEFMRRCCDISISEINKKLQKIQEMPVPTEESKKKEQQSVMTELTRQKLV